MLLHMLGLNSFGYWTGWTLFMLIGCSITVALMMMVLWLSLGNTSALIVYSSAAVIVVLFLLHALSSIWFCFFISTIFNDSKIQLMY